MLTINGTVFFDGDAVFHDSAVSGQEYIVHVNGRGTILAAGNTHVDEAICEGGSGTTDCRSNMSNWDPSQNLLVYAGGGLNKQGAQDLNFHEDGSAFQGILYCVNVCKVNDNTLSSGPIIAGDLSITSKPTLYAWPALKTVPGAESTSGGPWTVSVISETG